MTADPSRTAGTDDQETLLAARFDAAMLEIYGRAGREVGYWAS